MIPDVWGLLKYDPADSTTPKMTLESNNLSADMIWWNDLVYFRCATEVEPWYYGLCSSDGVSAPVMEAYTTTNFNQSSYLLLGDSALY